MRIFKDLFCSYLLSLTLFTGLIAVALPATAQQNDDDISGTISIAAVVNEDVITIFDVQSRLGLFLVTAGIQNTPEVQQRLVPQVMDTPVSYTHLTLPPLYSV